MRTLILLATLLISVAAAVPVESAGPPSAVTIEYVMAFTGPETAAGTWSATGAIEDQGAVTEFFDLTADPAPAQVAEVTRMLFGVNGTLTIRSTVGLRSF